MSFPTRGILFPARLPSFERIAPPPPVADLVAWFWVPRWDIAPGRTSRQQVLAFPASNLVVESPSREHPAGFVGFAGPTTSRSHRDLSGRGWAVGAQLRPAAVPSFTSDPSALRDAYERVDAEQLRVAVSAAMHAPSDETQTQAQTQTQTQQPQTQQPQTQQPISQSQSAVAVFAEWLAMRVGQPDAQGLLANRAAELLSGDVSIVSAQDAAERLAISTRTLQRLTASFVGLSPAAMIRRRRLQEAADRVRSDPAVDLATLAADLGYADHAHLTNEFRRVLAMAPSEYRRQL